MKKKLLFPILLFPFIAFSQVGIGTVSPDSSSELDIVASDKGILIPRVALTGTTDNSTISNGNVNSLLVFNTATTADIVPGYFYWLNNKWNKLKAPETGNGAPTSTGLAGDIYVDSVTGNIFSNNGTTWIPQSLNDWHIMGNSGTTPATNFIGTTDAQDFIIKANNIELGRFSGSKRSSLALAGGTITSSDQISVGLRAGYNGLPDASNYSIYIGDYSGLEQSCTFCIGIGYGALSQGTGGIDNVVLGNGAGTFLTNVTHSNMIGTNAGFNSQGINNVFIGTSAGYYANGNENIFIGHNTGQNTTTNSSIVIGNSSTNLSYTNSIALGNGVQNSASNQLKIGDAAGTLYDLVIPKYLNTRNDTAVTPQTNIIYTDTNGKFLSAPYFEGSILTYTPAADPSEVSTAEVAAHGIILINSVFPTTVPLPSAAASKGRKYTVKKISGGSDVTISAVSGSIDGAATLLLSVMNSGVTLVSNGTDWFVIAKF